MPISTTLGTPGNALTSQSLPGGQSVPFVVDLTAKYEGQVQITSTGGATVAAGGNVQVDVYRTAETGATPNYDTVGQPSFQITTVASSAARGPIVSLGPGKYQIRLLNNDATNAVTVLATLSTVDSI